MFPHRAVGEQFVAFDEDVAERREVERIEYFEACGKFPGGEERKNTEDTEPVGKNIPNPPPRPA